MHPKPCAAPLTAGKFLQEMLLSAALLSGEAPGRGTHPGEDPTPAQGLAVTGRDTNQGQNGDAAHPVIVFDEDGPIGDAGLDPVAVFSGPAVTRSSRLALQRSSRPASRVPVVLGFVLVVVAIAVVVVLAAGIGTHHTTSPTTLVRHHVTTPPHNQTTTTRAQRRRPQFRP